MVPPGGAPPQQSPGGGSHVDWKRLDKARREVGPVHLDLIEHYASGKVSRRNFIRRGTIIGLSMPVIGAVIAAVRWRRRWRRQRLVDDGRRRRRQHDGRRRTTSAAPGTTGAGQAGGTIRIGYQAPAGPLDPIQMQDLGSYGVVAQCFEFLVELGADGELAPGLAESWEPNDDGTVWTFQLREAKWQDGTDFTSADVAATMDRLVVAENSGLPGVIAEGAVDTTDPRVAVFNARGGRTATSRPGLRASTPRRCITPVELRDRHDARPVPNGTGPWKLVTFDAATGATFERNPDWWGGQTPLDGQEYHVLRRARHHGHGHPGRSSRRHRAVLRPRRRRIARRRELQRAGGRGDDPPADLDGLPRPAVRREGGPPGVGATRSTASR